MTQDSLLQTLRFVEEIDRLKGIQRQTLTYDGTRRENSAEHSWHLATSVMVLSHLANEPFDLVRAMKMALVHDIVEIDAGDTFIYDETGYVDKEAREIKAADRIFGILEGESGWALRLLWVAYEDQACPESRFVAALDRLLPTIANMRTQGHSWKKHGIVKSQVLDKVRAITLGSEKLGAYAEGLIEEAVRNGILEDR